MGILGYPLTDVPDSHLEKAVEILYLVARISSIVGWKAAKQFADEAEKIFLAAEKNS